METIKRVCIFGDYVADVLCENKVIGGAELQMALLAKGLSDHGIHVVIVDPMRERDIDVQCNLSVKGFPNWNRGIRGIRLFTHRIPRLMRVFREVKADVYYVRGPAFFSLIPLLFAKIRRVAFAFATAHDSDLMGFSERYTSFYKHNGSLWDWISTFIPNELATTLLVRLSDVVFVQHEQQQTLAQRRGRKAILLKNIVADDLFHVPTNGDRRNITIIGALSARKSLRVLVPVVAKLSDITFEFIGEAEGCEGLGIKRDLMKYPNVILWGSLDHQRTIAKLATAKALLSTSQMEGFPNVFLEAWALGTPVISLYFDPAGILKSQNLGYICDGNLELMEQLLQREHYDILPDRARDYVRQHHSAESALGVFQRIAVNKERL
jgi:glycosyltransferase involved in cell wall biosynthesis